MIDPAGNLKFAGALKNPIAEFRARMALAELAEMTAPHRGKPPLGESFSVQKALEAALAAAPESRLSFLAFPGNGFAGPREFVAFMQGKTPWTRKLLRPLLIDAETGAVLEQPGLSLKFIWAALDVLCIVVLGSGLYLWAKKREPAFDASAADRARADELAVAGALPAVRFALNNHRLKPVGSSYGLKVRIRVD
jgi:uncharacterized iron-regulated membrane protein